MLSLHRDIREEWYWGFTSYHAKFIIGIVVAFEFSSQGFARRWQNVEIASLTRSIEKRNEFTIEISVSVFIGVFLNLMRKGISSNNGVNEIQNTAIYLI